MIRSQIDRPSPVPLLYQNQNQNRGRSKERIEIDIRESILLNERQESFPIPQKVIRHPNPSISNLKSDHPPPSLPLLPRARNFTQSDLDLSSRRELQRVPQNIQQYPLESSYIDHRFPAGAPLFHLENDIDSLLWSRRRRSVARDQIDTTTSNPSSETDVL